MQNNTESSELLLPLDKKKALRERVLAIKEQLPSNWRSRLVAQYPQYDKMIYASLLANVVAGRTSDEALTIALEGIAQENSSHSIPPKAKGQGLKASCLAILLFASLMACKKSEVKPRYCYLVQWEKVTVYGAGSGDAVYNTQSKPQVEQGSEVHCDMTAKGIEALLKSLNGMTHPSAGVCITIHAVAAIVDTKK